MAITRIDSNIVGLRIAEETDLKTLPGSPTWYPFEPNSFSDFGGQIKTVARKPLSASRQNQKGTITDLEAAGGFEQDLTQDNLLRILQGFLFADAREKATTKPLNELISSGVPITAVDGTAETYAVDSDPSLGFLAGHLVYGSGFNVATNNGLHKIATVSASALTTTGLDDEASPPAAAKLQAVGYEFADGTIDLEMVGGLPRLVRKSGTFDLTTLGLVRGEWIFVGGDAAGTTFANNVGYARVNAIAATYIELDKVSWAPQAEVGTGKTLRIWFGTVVKNESEPSLVKRRSYHLERSTGSDDDGAMYEYLVGAIANQLGIAIKTADKATCDLSFVACEHEPRTGAEGVKAAGTRPAVVPADCFNTSSDVKRVKMSLVSATSATPAPIAAYASDFAISINNNVSADKAIGTLGAIGTSAGNFDVSGSGTFYFAGQGAAEAARQNSDVTFDIIFAKNNAGMVFDLPLVSIGNARLQIEPDRAIMLPIEMSAAESKFNHTLLVSHFKYLPTVAI